MPGQALPEIIRYTVSPRGDCSVDCPAYKSRREAFIEKWQSMLEKQKQGIASEGDIEEGFAAIRGVNKTVEQTWNCPGRMELMLGDSETPCRNQVFQQETE